MNKNNNNKKNFCITRFHVLLCKTNNLPTDQFSKINVTIEVTSAPNQSGIGSNSNESVTAHSPDIKK